MFMLLNYLFGFWVLLIFFCVIIKNYKINISKFLKINSI